MAVDVNVRFGDDVWDELCRCARDSGRSMSELFQDAVTLDRYLTDLRMSGGRVLVERPVDGFRELQLRRLPPVPAPLVPPVRRPVWSVLTRWAVSFPRLRLVR